MTQTQTQTQTPEVLSFSYGYDDDEYGDNDFHYEWLKETLADYVARIPDHFDGFYIQGRNLGWQRSAGYAGIELDADALADFLLMDDCTLQCEWNTATHTMEVSRSHHDAPTGESITITPTWQCDLSEDYVHPAAPNFAPAMTLLEADDIPDRLKCTKVSWEGFIDSLEAEPWYSELFKLGYESYTNPPNPRIPTLDEVLAIISKEPSQ